MEQSGRVGLALVSSQLSFDKKKCGNFHRIRSLLLLRSPLSMVKLLMRKTDGDNRGTSKNEQSSSKSTPTKRSSQPVAQLWSILVKWLECRFLDTEVDGSNPGISVLCP